MISANTHPVGLAGLALALAPIAFNLVTAYMTKDYTNLGTNVAAFIGVLGAYFGKPLTVKS
jgi:hypothetical protein